MSLERIETMCIQNRRLLVAIADALLKGVSGREADELRRAIADAQPWRDSAPDKQEPK